jgi:hypothetical protein
MTPMQLQFPRTRDCYPLFKGDSYPVAISDSLLASGWQGGIGVMWADSAKDEFMVTLSDGLYGGFLLWGSNEDSDQLIGMVGAQQAHRYATFCAGGWLMATTAFERYTWQSRQAGPLVPITYQVGERLVFSLRGRWTNQDEWSLSGDPRGSNQYFVGCVVQVPSSDNNQYMTIQTSI